jgi:glutamyl-tRNA reductase
MSLPDRDTLCAIGSEPLEIAVKLVLHNLTYHDSPVEIREKVSLSLQQRRAMLEAMRRSEKIHEALVLQTCNRLEFYLYAATDFDTEDFLRKYLAAYGADLARTWAAHSSQTSGTDVVKHLFEVASGLDSQMVGENQILAQVKAAYSESLDAHTSRLVLHRLFHHAFRVGKAVRTRTDISCGAVSVALAAVELAREKVNLSQAKAVVIGAGENADLVARYLTKSELSRLVIANRDVNRAAAIARSLKGATAIDLSQIVEQLPDTDVLISSTASSEPILTYTNVEWCLSGRTDPLLVIDIAVPRDIDPAIGSFGCVSLYNIDDLDEQISTNRRKRNSEIPKAKAIVEEFVTSFERWYDSLDLVPAISRLTQAGLDLARSEAKRYAKDFGADQSDKLQAFAESLVKKVLHGPIRFMKNGEDPTTEQLQAVDLINRMFLCTTEKEMTEDGQAEEDNEG